MCEGAYWVCPWGFQLGGRVSYIVAFRQFSIVLAVAAAFVIYKECGLARCGDSPTVQRQLEVVWYDW